MAFTLRPATGEHFAGRRVLMAEMLEELSDPASDTGFALVGQRRIGKTSILLEAARRLGEGQDGVVPVYFSVWSLLENDLEACAGALSAAVLEAYRPITGLALRARSLAQLPAAALMSALAHTTVTLSCHDIALIFSPRQGGDGIERFEKALGLAEGLALATGTKCVLFIDEFPALMDLTNNRTRCGAAILRTIRTLHERWSHTVLCIAGSVRSTMEMAALSPASPLCRQFIVREVGPLSRNEAATLLSGAMAVTDAEIDDIYRFSGGIPFYIQFLGRMISRGPPAPGDRIAAAAAAFLREEGNLLFRGEFDALSPKERLIAAGLARGHATPAALSRACGDRVAGIGRVLASLQEKGVAERLQRGVYRCADPVFARWICDRTGGEHFHPAPGDMP